LRTYTTAQGARRAGNGQPILRIHDASTGEEIFIPGLSMVHTTIYALPGTVGAADGSISFITLSAGGAG
jgi:hypothetical protein